MVRRFALVASFALAGCTGLRDALSAHQDVVARAAGQSLAVEELAALLAPAKNIPLRRDIVDRIADYWVDYELLGQAVASGDSLLDSATVRAANWPQVAERLVDHLHDTMTAARSRVTPFQLDSAFNAGDVRWLAHLLVSVQSGASAAVQAQKRREAEGYLAQLKRGSDFAALARAKSGDPGSARNGGSLGLVGRHQMVPPFDSAAWTLQPGEYSGVVQTQFGYHVIYRPPLAEVRDSFAKGLHDLFVARLDSLFLDSLNKHVPVDVRSSAPPSVRAAAQHLREAKAGTRVIATYPGGRLTQGDMARWMQGFSPQTLVMITQAPDSTLKSFVRSIARNAMLIHSAELRHIGLSAADQDTIRGAYRADLEQMIERLGVAPDSLAADTAASRDRARAIGRRVKTYFEDIVSSSPRHQFFAIQPFLSDVLRSRYSWNLAPLGIDRALARAKVLRGPETPPSGAPTPPQGGAGPTRPAPGGPPMGAQPPAGKAPGKSGS